MHVDVVLYPLANVEMEVDWLKVKVEAAVSGRLPVAVLLGKDVPEFDQLLGNRTQLRAERLPRGGTGGGDPCPSLTTAGARAQEGGAACFLTISCNTFYFCELVVFMK